MGTVESASESPDTILHNNQTKVEIQVNINENVDNTDLWIFWKNRKI